MLREWGEKQGVTIQHIQPGQPQQNACIERYNRTVSHAMVMDLQQRPPEHGHRRHHTRPETKMAS